MSDVIAVFPIEREDSLICHGAALRKATRRVSQLYDAVLAPCGLKVSQHSILSHIARAGAPSMTDLARLLVLDRSALAHNLKPWCEMVMSAPRATCATDAVAASRSPMPVARS